MAASKKSILKENCCVSICPTCQAAQQAIEELQKAAVDLRQVSIVGKGYHSEAHSIGFYSSGNCIGYRGFQEEGWSGLWGLLSGAAFFRVPGSGTLAAAGPIVTLLVRGADGIVPGDGFGVLGSALYSIGIPRSSIDQYQQAVRAEQLLLIVHGEHRDIEHACAILHDETRQVAVHRA